MASNYSIRQVIAANNGAVAATTLNIPITATQAGNLLLVFVSVTGNGITITMPTGWTLIRTIGSQPAGLSGALFIRNNCPAGLTSAVVTFSVAGLASGVVYELSGGNIPYIPQPQDFLNGFANTNQNSWGTGFVSGLNALNEAGIVCCIYLNNTALTVSNLQTLTQDAATITTAAAGNAGIITASNMNIGSAGISLGGFGISATPTNGPSTLDITLMVDLLLASNGYINGVYALPGGQSSRGVF